MLSNPFLAEILSFCLSSSALNFSASLTILSISSFDSLPLSLVIVILFCFPVDLSAADTFRIPLASMSNVTSICGNPTGSRGNVSEVKLAEVVVVLRHRTLTLVHLDRHGRLVVAVRGERLGLLGGNGGVPLDQRCHDATSSLNSKRKRSNIQQQEIRDGLAGIAGQDRSLHGSTIGNCLIRVDGLVQLLAVKEVLQKLLHLGDPS